MFFYILIIIFSFITLFFYYLPILIFLRCFLISLVILPLSYIYCSFVFLKNKYRFWKAHGSYKNHEIKVSQIVKQVHNAINNGFYPMCTGRPGWENMSPHNAIYKKKYFPININLYDIVELNTIDGYIVVEPMVNMVQITSLILPLGWTLPIIPELDDLTIGGLINGCGIESSSHIYGLFQEICEEFEIVSGTGKIIKCSKEYNSNLFYNIPWSYGTLGFLVSAKIKILPAKNYVMLEYYPIKNGNIHVISESFKKASMDLDYNFIEGIMYSPTSSVLMKGRMVDLPPEPAYPVNRINAFYKPWFYKYVAGFLDKYNLPPLVSNQRGRDTELNFEYVYKEYIPLNHYYHRHTKSLFWEIEHLLPFGNHPFFRILFGWMLPIKVSFLKLTQPESIKRVYENLHVAQDILVDVSKLADTLEFCDKKFQMYPIWLCPMKLYYNYGRGLVYAPKSYHQPRNCEKSNNYKMSKEAGDNIVNIDNQPPYAMYVDIGLYGMPKSRHFKPRESIHELENYLIDIQGFEMFYGDVFLTREEFDNMMHLGTYEALRKKYATTTLPIKQTSDDNTLSFGGDPDQSPEQPPFKYVLPHVYDKINRQARG